jgi:uncharacterized protein (DUF3084 family)
MNTTTTVALITISSLSLLVSSATLAAMLIGAKNVQSEMDELKMKTNKTVNKLKSALDDLEI